MMHLKGRVPKDATGSRDLNILLLNPPLPSSFASHIVGCIIQSLSCQQAKVGNIGPREKEKQTIGKHIGEQITAGRGTFGEHQGQLLLGGDIMLRNCLPRETHLAPSLHCLQR